MSPHRLKILSNFFTISRKRTNRFVSTEPFFSECARTFSSSINLHQKSDDENAKELAKDIVNIIKNPKLIQKGVSTVLGEFPKLYEEKAKSFIANVELEEFKDPRFNMKMLYKFETEDSLNNFLVTTDSSVNSGYSSASLKLTQNGTALFSGNISTVLPKTGDVTKTGFANMMTLGLVKSFGRPDKFNFKNYTHLVLKIRGDGRKNLIVLSTPGDYLENEHTQYCYPLYTRGGPYWQLVKVPFSHFVYGQKGSILDNQNETVPLNMIKKIGITVAGIDGPFKLEIDYIAIEKDEDHRAISPYESYQLGKHVAI